MASIRNFFKPGRETRSGDPVGRPGRETRSGDFVGTPPRVHNLREMRFQTYSHPDLKFYDEAAHLFYTAHAAEGGGRKKRVPENIH